MPRIDKLQCVVALMATLTLGSISFFIPCSHAQTRDAGEATLTSQPQQPSVTMNSTPEISDGDGDELLEHWGDPKYSHEERQQLAGLGLLFIGFGIAAFHRRQSLRRFYRHARS